jgi:hypothetical protein
MPLSNTSPTSHGGYPSSGGSTQALPSAYYAFMPSNVGKQAVVTTDMIYLGSSASPSRTVVVDGIDGASACDPLSNEPLDILKPIHLLTYDEDGKELTLTLSPERDISGWEALQLSMLLTCEMQKPHNIHISAYVRKNNLERHFTFRQGHAPFKV